MRRTLIRIMLAAGVASPFAAAPAFAGDVVLYDFFGTYLRRIDAITPGAGDAKEVNTVTHVIDPWPRYVGNRHIPGNGARMAGAAERYRDVSKIPLTPLPLSPTPIGTTGFSSTSGGGTATSGSSTQGQ